jgi:hypothetical protein
VDSASDGSLTLSYDSTRFSTFMFLFAAALLAGSGYHWLSPEGDDERLVGFLGGAATCAVAGVVLRERARTVVEPAARTVTWTRSWAFRTRAGSMSFDEIAAVVVERPLGDNGVPSRRIVIRTHRGDTVPLTAGYRPDGDERMLRASERIRGIVGLDASPEDIVRTLVQSGRTMDAIRWLREHDGLSLTEAKQRVDAVRDRLRGS